MKTAILGVGNIIFKDEGIGVYALAFLAKNYRFEGDVTLVDGGVLGFGLMSYYQEYDRVLILDTMTIDDEIGSIYNLPAKELMGLGSYKQSAHEVEIVEMLEICSLLEKMAEVNIVGIVPKDIVSVEIGLSNEMRARFDDFISIVLKELDRVGVEYIKNKKQVGLEDIIESYLNPR